MAHAARDAARPLVSPHLLLTLTVLFWAGNAVVGRAVVDEMPPVTLAFWRWVTALMILLPVGGPRLWRHRAVIIAEWRIVVFLALFGIAGFNTLLYLALERTTAVNATIVGATGPAIITLLSWFAHRTRARLGQVAGIAASLLGVVIVVSEGSWAVFAAAALNPGDLIALLAVIVWAVYSVALVRRPNDLDGITLLTAIVAIGVVILFPIYMAASAWSAPWQPNAETFAAVAYTGLFPSVLAYVFWNRGVAALGPGVASIYINLIPAFGVVLAVSFLGETFAIHHGIGIAFIVLGVRLATRSGADRSAVSQSD